MRRYDVRTNALVLVGLILGAAPGSADELRLDADALLRKALVTDLRWNADRTAIELDEGELYEDDGPGAGFSYKPNEERLSATTWIRKELIVSNPQARRATLLVGPGGGLRCIVNGKSIELRDPGKAGNYWQTYSLPVESLKAGSNEIVLHGDGKVWIARADEYATGAEDRRTPPQRSARSNDGGKTWERNRLGPKGDIAGEYCVRLFLDHHRRSGSLLLPVIDAANLTDDAIGPPVVAVGPVRVRLQAEGRVKVQARSGTSFVPNPKSWTDWQTLDDGILAQPAGRFVQVRLELSTDDPLRSPQLNEIVLEAAPKRGSDWIAKIRPLEVHNPTIVRTSIPFRYEPFDHPRLKALREKYRLNEVVEGAKSELELIAKLAVWSSKQWERGHLKNRYPAWDALEILKLDEDGTPVGGFCQQYNLVFLQACESFGIPGRAVSLGTGDGDRKIPGSGHEVVEIWSNDHRKWVYLDGNAAWYLIDAEARTPLSLWELRQRQLQLLKGEPSRPVRVVKLAETRMDWKGLDGWPPFLELRLIPRSNFLEEPTPLPLNQGMRGWFWPGHHVWTDADAKASLLYGRRVTNRANFEWTLNQAQVRLEAMESPGALRVHLDTETPGFDVFVAEIDGTRRTVKSEFLWNLRVGKNRLEVWPRNKAGRDGIASRIVLDYSGD